MVPRPRLVGVGVGLVIAAAAVNVAIGVLLAITSAANPVAVQPGLLAVVVVVSVVYSAAIVILAVLFYRGVMWARGALLAVSALSLLTLFAPNALNLIVTALLIASTFVLQRRPVGEWVRASKGLLPV